MKQTILIVLLIFLFCCREKSREGEKRNPNTSKRVEVDLKNNLGYIDICLSDRYDTMFSWIHYSDCGSSCDQAKYRIQSKKTPIVKETGFIWDERIDSVDYVTVSHTMDTSAYSEKREISRDVYESIRMNLVSNNIIPKIILDTILNVNGRFFSILAVEKEDSINIKNATAVTIIKNKEVKIQYEIRTKKKDDVFNDFIKDFVSFIESIKVVEK